jgi:hypothetical protein
MKSLFKISITVIISILTFYFYQPLYAQEKKEQEGKIEKFEKELDEKKKDSSKNRKSRRESDDEEGSSFWGSLIGELIVKPVFFGVFIGIGDEQAPYNVNLWNSYFSDYPYAKSDVGLYSSADRANKHFSIKLAGNYFYNSSDLQGFDFKASLCPLPFLGFALDFTDLTEDSGLKNDHIQFYNIFVNYFRGRWQHMSFWWGLGVKGIDGDRNRCGPALNVGTEIYPLKPISLHFNYNIGAVTQNAVGELLLQLNFHLQRSIFYIGYQRYSVGSSNLDGAIAGIGIYL